MGYRFHFAIMLSLLLLSVCSTTEWVNRNNPKANYTLDYNTCESDMS